MIKYQNLQYLHNQVDFHNVFVSNYIHSIDNDPHHKQLGYDHAIMWKHLNENEQNTQ